MNNFEWLNTFTPLIHTNWYYDKVIRISDIDNIMYYQKNGDEYEAIINPQDIKGINYAYAYNCYSDITWVDLLNSLIRFYKIRKNKHTYWDLIEHVHNDYSEDKTVLKFGDILITSIGQHRLTLAKFLNLTKIKVKIIEYKFNKEKHDEYLIRKLFLEKLLFWHLIKIEEYDKCLHFDGHFLSIMIADRYVLINKEFLIPLIELYSNLSTSRILIFKDKFLGNDVSDDKFYRTIKIDSTMDIKNLRPYLRKQKFLRRHLIDSEK